MIERFDPRAPQYAQHLHGAPAVGSGGLAPAGLDAPVLDGGEKKPRRKGSRSAWIVSMVAMGAVVGLVIIGFLRFVNDPVEAGANAKPSLRPVPAAVNTTGVNQLGGLNFTFNYPAIFDQTAPKHEPQSLEQYNLGSKSNYRHLIAVDVRMSQPGGVTDDASYKYRLLHAELYAESIEKINGENVVLMTKKDKQEQTMFWGHQGKQLTVSVTSTDPKDDVTAILSVIKASTRWNK
jgi:hypothetical protein